MRMISVIRPASMTSRAVTSMPMLPPMSVQSVTPVEPFLAPPLAPTSAQKIRMYAMS